MNAALWCHFLFCLFWLAECFWIDSFFKFSSWLLLLLWKLKSCVCNSANTSYFWPNQQWWSTWEAVQSVWKLSCFGGFWEPVYILIGLKAKRSQHRVAVLYWCSSASFLAPDTSPNFLKKPPQKKTPCVCFQPQTSWRNVWFKSTLDFQCHSRITAASDFSLGSHLFRSVAGVQIKSSKYV